MSEDINMLMLLCTDEELGEDLYRFVKEFFSKVEKICEGRGKRPESITEYDFNKAGFEYGDYCVLIERGYLEEHNNGYNAYSFTPTESGKNVFNLPMLGWMDI